VRIADARECVADAGERVADVRERVADVRERVAPGWHGWPTVASPVARRPSPVGR